MKTKQYIKGYLDACESFRESINIRIANLNGIIEQCDSDGEMNSPLILKVKSNIKVLQNLMGDIK